jgi:DsbC/DsbD-like thiol-disulfide interchange protein
MPALLRLITFLAVCALLGTPQGSYAEASPWTEGHRSRVRLLAGGTDGAGQLAGIEISLDAGFKTYWRNPGESGLPPAFDWSTSRNVGEVEVLWPAPARFEDAGGVAYGYQGRVLFPVRVRPQDPTKPIGLGLKIDYGVCKDICIPAQAELSLKLPTTTSAPTRALIEEALARVPKPRPLKAGGDLAVLGAEPTASDGKPRLAVKVRAPGDSNPSLFVEAPENWFVLASPRPSGIASEAGTKTFLVDVLERPRDAAGPVDLRFTLVAGDRAVETSASLDAARLER